MPGILALVLLAIAAVVVLSFAVHMLPWLLAAAAIVALVKFSPRRAHREFPVPGHPLPGRRTRARRRAA